MALVFPTVVHLRASDPDREDLRRFASGGSAGEAAFARLVGRYRDLVHRCAWCQVGEFAADDVCQAVFVLLARRARHLAAGGARHDLAGWLVAATARVAANQRRSERRRRRREQPRQTCAHHRRGVAGRRPPRAGAHPLDRRLPPRLPSPAAAGHHPAPGRHESERGAPRTGAVLEA